jgi:hypothetical protein
VGEEPTYDHKKTWPSINHSVLSASKYLAREWALILKSEFFLSV